MVGSNNDERCLIRNLRVEKHRGSERKNYEKRFQLNERYTGNN